MVFPGDATVPPAHPAEASRPGPVPERPAAAVWGPPASEARELRWSMLA